MFCSAQLSIVNVVLIAVLAFSLHIRHPETGDLHDQGVFKRNHALGMMAAGALAAINCFKKYDYQIASEQQKIAGRDCAKHSQQAAM